MPHVLSLAIILTLLLTGCSEDLSSNATTEDAQISGSDASPLLEEGDGDWNKDGASTPTDILREEQNRGDTNANADEDSTTPQADSSLSPPDSENIEEVDDAETTEDIETGEETSEVAEFLTLGEPIDASPLEWVWVPFPETNCGDGSPTGLGINLSPGATRALIYLEGGGACWDWNTCFGLIPTSFHLSGYDEASFNGLLTQVYLNTLLFNREEPKNPLRDAHLVFIPYCTGDAHAGDRVLELSGLLPWEKEMMHFKGHSNLIQFLNRLVPTFSDVEHVVLAGGSAGGFGAGINWPWVAEAFQGQAGVDLLDDSGPPLEPAGDLWQTWVESWGLVLPSGCPECADGLSALLDHLRETVLLDNRMGLASYTHDPIISIFFTMLPSQFAGKLEELTAVFDAEAHAQYFILPGALHTMTIGPGYELLESQDGMPLWFWIDQMISDDPEWASHGPW